LDSLRRAPEGQPPKDSLRLPMSDERNRETFCEDFSEKFPEIENLLLSLQPKIVKNQEFYADIHL
jgi:hypothetical protein